MNPKQRVLFLCTGNSARSQMAEAFLRRFGDEYFESYSAGLQPKGINPLTIRVMNDIGYDLAGQYSKSVQEFLGKILIYRLITVCDQAKKNCPSAWPGIVKKEHWSIEDPAAFEGSDEAKLAKFREIRDQIEQMVHNWVAAQGSVQAAS